MGYFEHSSGLFYLDLNTSDSCEQLRLGMEVSFPELSPDHRWVAYAGKRNPSLTIRNLVTDAKYTFPAMSGNYWQPGCRVFSPDNTHVAWMEAKGYIMGDTPDFQTMVRVGITNGLRFDDYPAKYFNTVTGFPVIRARPVAWLDNDSVLIQVSDDKNEAVLRLDLPNTLVYINSGVSISLTYP